MLELITSGSLLNLLLLLKRLGLIQTCESLILLLFDISLHFLKINKFKNIFRGFS